MAYEELFTDLLKAARIVLHVPPRSAKEWGQSRLSPHSPDCWAFIIRQARA